jgi:hypothetical protein
MNKFILLTLLLFALAGFAQHQTPMPGMMGPGMQCPMAGMMGSFDVKYEATSTGATLVFTPKDPAKVAELQRKIREMTEHMKKMSDSEGPHDNHHPGK